MSDKERIAAAMKRFPETFGLRSFPGCVFRIGERESFIDDANEIKLYTQRFVPGRGWLDFAKGTEIELRNEITAAPEVLRA